MIIDYLKLLQIVRGAPAEKQRSLKELFKAGVAYYHAYYTGTEEQKEQKIKEAGHQGLLFVLDAALVKEEDAPKGDLVERLYGQLLFEGQIPADDLLRLTEEQFLELKEKSKSPGYFGRPI